MAIRAGGGTGMLVSLVVFVVSVTAFVAQVRIDRRVASSVVDHGEQHSE